MTTPKAKDSDWLTRNAIATRIGMARSTVQRLTALPDSPKPDKKRRYYWPVIEPFLKAHTKWARAGQSPEATAMRLEMLALDLEEKQQAAGLCGRSLSPERHRALLAATAPWPMMSLRAGPFWQK